LVSNAFAHTHAILRTKKCLVPRSLTTHFTLSLHRYLLATCTCYTHCHSFCDPLCLSLTWECRIDGSGDFSEVKQFPISNALCANFIAHGCSKMLHCCDKKDPLLWNWVETRW
jgi:hypothetical protein